MRVSTVPTLALALAIACSVTWAAPMPTPLARRSPEPNAAAIQAASPTALPRALSVEASPNEVFDFYRPITARQQQQQEQQLVKRNEQLDLTHADDELAPTPTKRSDVPSVPLSQLGPPSFPAQYPSCYNCQQKYSSLSSCMEASSVFANATSIFNSPLSYIAVIKCACTDTFQAVYPQCVQCFQMTDQCYYLGTDPEGTGAPELVTNIRQICAFGSSLLGGVNTANYPDYNNTLTVSEVPAYTDVTQGGSGYIDQAAGPIFGAASHTSAAKGMPLLIASAMACLLALTVM